MQITYKKIPKLIPHCGYCGEELQGNNSCMFPYRCKCGEWELDTAKYYRKSKPIYILKKPDDIRTT